MHAAACSVASLALDSKLCDKAKMHLRKYGQCCLLLRLLGSHLVAPEHQNLVRYANLLTDKHILQHAGTANAGR